MRGRGLQDEELQLLFPGHGEVFPEGVLQIRLQRKPDVHQRGARSEEFPRLCTDEIDIGTCCAVDLDLLAGLPAFANLYATDHRVSKIYMTPLVWKKNVFRDIDMLADEGRQAMFLHVASGQPASPDRSEELDYTICDVIKGDESVPKCKRQDFVERPPLHFNIVLDDRLQILVGALAH